MGVIELSMQSSRLLVWTHFFAIMQATKQSLHRICPEVMSFDCLKYHKSHKSTQLKISYLLGGDNGRLSWYLADSWA